MQARIRRYVDDRVTMAAAMAHDLRTPLMRLSLRVEKVGPEVRPAMGSSWSSGFIASVLSSAL